MEGDYLVAVSGVSTTNKAMQFFYDLRIMSPTDELASWTTSTAPPELGYHTTVLPASDINVYSGASLTTSGTYTITLTSLATTTSGYPHVFVYGDDQLTIGSLLFSSVSTSTGFSISSFDQGALLSSTSSELSVISNIAFSTGGPFIVVRGVTNVEYTLKVDP